MNTKFGETINKFLLIFDLDRKEMAYLCGVSISTIINWQTGRTIPRNEPLRKDIETICSFLDELFTLNSQKKWTKTHNSELHGLTPFEYLYKAGIRELTKKLYII